jgi:hypothetical protein
MIVAVLTTLVTPTFAQEWVEYVHLTDRFIVLFPDAPTVRETTYVSAHDVVFPAREYSVRNSRGLFSMIAVDYTEAERRHEERPDQTDASSGERFWVMDVRASVAYEAQRWREQEGEITYDGWADINKVEGHQLQITNPDESRSFVGIFLNDSRLYVLNATVPKGFPAPELFRTSLQFLDENGRRVRYTTDPNGQRIDAQARPLDDPVDGMTRMVVE